MACLVGFVQGDRVTIAAMQTAKHARLPQIAAPSFGNSSACDFVMPWGWTWRAVFSPFFFIVPGVIPAIVAEAAGVWTPCVPLGHCRLQPGTLTVGPPGHFGSGAARTLHGWQRRPRRQPSAVGNGRRPARNTSARLARAKMS